MEKRHGLLYLPARHPAVPEDPGLFKQPHTVLLTDSGDVDRTYRQSIPVYIHSPGSLPDLLHRTVFLQFPL